MKRSEMLEILKRRITRVEEGNSDSSPEALHAVAKAIEMLDKLQKEEEDANKKTD